MGELKIILKDGMGQVTGELSLKHSDSTLNEVFNRVINGMFRDNDVSNTKVLESKINCKCESTSEDKSCGQKSSTTRLDYVNKSRSLGAIRRDQDNKPRNILAISDKKVFLSEGSTGFITQKCPHCNHVFNGLSKSGTELKCYNCGKTFTTPTKLVKIDYICPYCESKGYGYTPENQEVGSIQCKQCKVPIDIVYVEKFGKYISANLAK